MDKKKHYVGLTDQEVIESREKYGANVLTPPEKEPLWKQYLETFKDPIIRILLVALVLCVGVAIFHIYKGDQGASALLEPTGILVAILLATGISFGFTVSANNKFDILNQVNDNTEVKVIRNGSITSIPKKDVVVGDIIAFEAGEEIVADGVLLEAISLKINESTLTGEPLVDKTTNEADFDEEATYPSNEVYRGTTVLDGHGIMQVKAVGSKTQSGESDEKAQEDNEIETPLNKQLNTLADLITKVSYVLAILIIGVRLVLYFYNLQGDIDWLMAGTYILNTVMIAVTIIVVAVPEGLPMAVTLSLALSMKRMLKTNNLVRKLHACETMGATTVICTDKTGTLTKNQMQVYQTNFYGLQDQELKEDDISALLKENLSVNSTAYLEVSEDGKPKVLGNPTEGALLLWLNGQNVNYLDIREQTKVVELLTFSTERKYMATVVQSPLLNKKILYVKGAPEIVFANCKEVQEKMLVPTSQFQQEVDSQLLAYQNQAMRTLGFAYKIIEDNDVCFVDGKLASNDLIFLGISAISDPIRDDVPDAIQTCIEAGISVKIVTGDTPGTAKEIGRQIGLWNTNESELHHMTGAEFAQMTDAELLDRVEELKIMSRARPLDKERLVKLLQQKDEVVAVTGDGTNDAPALNAAQVGLSMGDGTSVAKEASDITILDNSFASISRAVMWGRSLYQNIQRFILFQMTINVAACLIVLIGSFLGTDSPLTVTQMLWVNLIMDTFAALALASIPPNENVMKEKPRDTNAHIISKPMSKRIVGVGLVFVCVLFGLLQYFRHVEITSLTEFKFSEFFSNYFNFSAPSQNLSPYELSLFFTIFVVLQFWNMFNAKAFLSGKSAFYQMGQNFKGFGIVGLIILVGQYLIVTFGGEMFNVVPLSWTDWGIILASTSLVLWIGELLRWIKNLK